jgi:hypothetical protein
MERVRNVMSEELEEPRKATEEQIKIMSDIGQRICDITKDDNPVLALNAMLAIIICNFAGGRDDWINTMIKQWDLHSHSVIKAKLEENKSK